MGSSFSVFSTRCRQFSNRFLDSNSFQNTKSVDATTNTTTSDSAAGDDPKQENSKRLAELVQPRFLAICAGSLSLLVNPPKNIPKEFTAIVLFKLYLLFLLCSFLPCIALCFIPKGTPSKPVERLHEHSMKIAMVSITMSVILRIILELPPPIEWYDVCVAVAIAIGTLIYLRYVWIKANNSGQTASSRVESSNELIPSETPVLQITTNP